MHPVHSSDTDRLDSGKIRGLICGDDEAIPHIPGAFAKTQNNGGSTTHQLPSHESEPLAT